MASKINYKPIDPIIRKDYPLGGSKITRTKIFRKTGVILSASALSRRARAIGVRADKSAAAGRTWATKAKKYGDKYKSIQSARKFIREKYSTHGADWCEEKTGRSKGRVVAMAHEMGVKLLPEVRGRLISEGQLRRRNATESVCDELNPGFIPGVDLTPLEQSALFRSCTSIHKGVTRETYIHERN
ncbi:MAG: hypothetical protein GY800_02210 [Planctomycetes bacterium]|nr:hypothetical protein [Planctomycetota bacterium]